MKRIAILLAVLIPLVGCGVGNKILGNDKPQGVPSGAAAYGEWVRGESDSGEFYHYTNLGQSDIPNSIGGVHPIMLLLACGDSGGVFPQIRVWLFGDALGDTLRDAGSGFGDVLWSVNGVVYEETWFWVYDEQVLNTGAVLQYFYYFPSISKETERPQQALATELSNASDGTLYISEIGFGSLGQFDLRHTNRAYAAVDNEC